MKVKEIKDLARLFEGTEYDDFNLVFWDYARQKKMDGSFGSFSRPDKELTIPIHVIEEHYFPKTNTEGMPAIIPSPFVEGKNAYLKQDDNYTFDGRIFFTRYFYECEETGYQFSTTASDTFSMLEYYVKECRRLRQELAKYESSKDDVSPRLGSLSESPDNGVCERE